MSKRKKNRGGEAAELAELIRSMPRHNLRPKARSLLRQAQALLNAIEGKNR